MSVALGGGASVVDRLVRRGPEIPMHARGNRGIPETVRHQDPDHLLLRVGIPRRAIATVPAVSARDRLEVFAPDEDGDAEAPSAVVSEAGEEIRSGLLLERDVVGRHELNRGPDRMR